MAFLGDNAHSGHRARMKARYDKTHLDGFSEHEILEMLLFYSIRQSDTNATAHELLKRFDSIRNVINAPAERLMQVKGVGAESARMLKMLGDVYEFIGHEKEPIVLTQQNSYEYFMRLFRGKKKETFFIICLDARDRILTCKQLSEGLFNSVEIECRDVAQIALDFSSPQVVLAHNHPSGIAIASDNDIALTRALDTILHTLGVKLRDHIIVAGDKCVSIKNDYHLRTDKSLMKNFR